MGNAPDRAVRIVGNHERSVTSPGRATRRSNFIVRIVRSLRKSEMAGQNNGHLTRPEVVALNQQENAVSRQIGW
jgi:hypothetical protein